MDKQCIATGCQNPANNRCIVCCQPICDSHIVLIDDIPVCGKCRADLSAPRPARPVQTETAAV
nr:hypothetical protein [uncultured bacterium]AQS30234.1 hypothetical protein [uncultured bacterium]